MANRQAVAVIGLGSMGLGAAQSLVRAGYETHGVDVRTEVLDRFAGDGGLAHRSPAEAAAKAEVVFVFVVNAAQTEAVLFGDDGAVAAARAGTVFVLCVTIPPSTAVDFGDRLAKAGMRSIDSPVSGGAAKAATGEMTIMGSGADEAFAAAAGPIGAVASRVFRLGDRPGVGSQVKMINQLLAGVHIAAMAEAMVLAAGVGLDLATVYEVICESAGNSWMFQNRGAHVVEGDYSPRSAVDIFVKDLGIVAGEAGAKGMPTPLTAAALALFKQAAAEGLGREDDAAVAKILARQGKVALPGISE